eukprot:m.217198 g.217198  ORF g.217198 m.217198 type:complete len:111 (-) comp28998_c0_seq1:399-731(-)
MLLKNCRQINDSCVRASTVLRLDNARNDRDRDVPTCGVSSTGGALTGGAGAVAAAPTADVRVDDAVVVVVVDRPRSSPSWAVDGPCTASWKSSSAVSSNGEGGRAVGNLP